MILVDSNILVALADRSDTYHGVCQTWLSNETGASIIAVAERLGIDTVATVNRRDFDNVRPAHVTALNIVP